MGTLLFLLLFFFVLLPLGRIAWAAWQQYRLIKRHMRQAQEFQDTFRRAQQEAYGDRHTQPHSQPRKKKIARDVGEYVAFEEVRVYAASEPADDAPAASTPSGSQVEDADWEDIR